MGIEVQRDEAVARVTLAWPERRNAVGPREAAELVSVIQELGHSGDLKAIVLTGRGAFCAGGDLAAIRKIVRAGEAAVRDALYSTFQQLPRVMLQCPIPTIAAIDGAAVGLGMDLALMCDQRFVGPDGWLRQGWAALGLIPGTGGELLLRRLAPAALWRLVASQTRIDAVEAAKLGIASPAAESAVDEADAYARSLAGLPQATLEAYVRLYRLELNSRLDEHLSLCLEEQVKLLLSSQFLARADTIMAGAEGGSA
jgi:enoyl-CoA hydratase/carnithine racemase